MTSTGTYAFNPAADGLTLSAFGRIQMRGPQVTMEHFADAAKEFNLLQVELSNNQPNLWRSETFPITLIEDQATYTLPVRMVAIQDVYMRLTANTVSSDRLLAPLSLTEYDAMADKGRTGIPTAYMIEKLMAPTITLNPIPDDAAAYTVYVRLLGQPQDVSLKNGTTLDMPYRYLDAAVAGLAHRMARNWKPELEMARKIDFKEALMAAQNTDTQDSVNIYFQPDFSPYYR
jgi:hypothetical protein